MSYAKKAKSLLIFDLDGVLCHHTKDVSKKAKLSGVYSSGDLKATPIYTDPTNAIYARP